MSTGVCKKASLPQGPLLFVLLTPDSGLPQLVEPVLWDYRADLDVHTKGQCIHPSIMPQP